LRTRVFDLNGKRLGLIGTGKIGLSVIGSPRLLAFEMEVMVYHIHGNRTSRKCLAFAMSRSINFSSAPMSFLCTLL
jgi:lactate dehydrogenase-like 2-hydroxyacid dehydrogenase